MRSLLREGGGYMADCTGVHFGTKVPQVTRQSLRTSSAMGLHGLMFSFTPLKEVSQRQNEAG